MAGEDVQVVHGGAAAGVEEVLAGAPVASAAALGLTKVGEAVFDSDAFT